MLSWRNSMEKQMDNRWKLEQLANIKIKSDYGKYLLNILKG